MSKQVIAQNDNMATISQKMSANYDELSSRNGGKGTVSLRKGTITVSDSKLVIGSASNRLFSARAISIEDFGSASVDSGYLVLAVYLDSGMLHLGQSSFAGSFDKSDIDVTGCKYIVLGLKKEDNTNFADGDDGGLVIEYTKMAQKNLEDYDCCGISLPALFLDANIVPGGDLLCEPSVWTNGIAGNFVYDSVSLSFSRSWLSTSNRSRIYQAISLKEGHKYLVACETRVTGTNFFGGTSKDNRYLGCNLVKPFGMATVSKGGYAIVLGVLDVPVETSAGTTVSKNISVGNIGIDKMIFGYTRNVVCIDLTELTFTVKPTRKDLFNAYRRYVEYLKCERVEVMNERMAEFTETEFCDSEAKLAFINEMNTVAKELGCSQSNFLNPNGVYDANHLTTCKDFLKIGAAAMTENAFLRIINTHSMDVPVIHSSGEAGFIVPTTIAYYSGPDGQPASVLNTDYEIVAAKPGSWNGGTDASKTQALIMVVRSKATKKFIVGYIHNGGSSYSADWNNSDKYGYIKNLFDKVEDDSVALDLGPTLHWSAGYISESNQWAKYVDFGTVKSGDTVQVAPASTTKYLTCILGLQHLKETELVEYDIFDFSTGSGADIVAGDIFTMRDVVYLCMASSSNTLANTIARFTGHRLLEERERTGLL